ncbi:LADA_0E14840g1_1 [Lachancea dasiensis]|uniref:Pre-mRNA-splicing factor CWC22 n=1 Tax=Lachancea dasiensis TaxID=1072105 RepID=A0A1G4JGL9_9SACH|nr:LADA_0E14840g1_1 [Lachancea dasiensis]
MSLEERPDELLQKEDWEHSKTHIDALIDGIDTTSITTTFQLLFAVNLVRGNRLIVNAIIRKALVSSGQVAKLAALGSILNSYIPSVGSLLVEESTLRFLEFFRSNNATGCYIMADLVSQLFNYDVAHEIVVLQLLHVVTEHLNPHSIRLTIYILRHCGKSLAIVAKSAHDLVFESLRTYFQNNKADKRLRNEFEAIFELRKRDYRNSPRKLQLPPCEPIPHTFFINFDDSLTPKAALDEFKYDPAFDRKDEEFAKVKSNATAVQSSDIAPSNLIRVEDKTQASELEFKKKIYLTLKGSLSGDEAAHKLLKLKVRDQDKSVLVETLAMACSQEATYSKFYGITAERLCSCHRTWKKAFEQVFKECYETMEEYEAKQIRNMGKFWGHILASDYIGFEVFTHIHMNAEDTTSAGRVYLKFLFQELVLDLGIEGLKNRLEEPYIQPFLANMFPFDDIDKTRFSINFFTAIGLGTLTEKMRQALDNERLALEEERSETYESNDEIEASITHKDQTSSTWERVHRLRQSRRAAADERRIENRRRSKTPTRRRSRTPTRRRSRTPTRRRSRTPTRRRSRTPVRRRSRSPKRQ